MNESIYVNIYCNYVFFVLLQMCLPKFHSMENYKALLILDNHDSRGTWLYIKKIPYFSLNVSPIKILQYVVRKD